MRHFFLLVFILLSFNLYSQNEYFFAKGAWGFDCEQKIQSHFTELQWDGETVVICMSDTCITKQFKLIEKISESYTYEVDDIWSTSDGYILNFKGYYKNNVLILTEVRIYLDGVLIGILNQPTCNC